MGEGVIIRLVNEWNPEEILHLYQAGGWWKDEYDPATLPELIRKSYAFVIAIEESSGRAVGMGRVLSDGISDGYVQDLVVLPAFRKKGIGKEIVTALVRRCAESGISWIGLIAEPGTEKFYEPLGFHVMKGHIPLLWNGGQ